jgi:hypothetical protein
LEVEGDSAAEATPAAPNDVSRMVPAATMARRVFFLVVG